MTKRDIQSLTNQPSVTDSELQAINNALDSTQGLDMEQLESYMISFKTVLAKGYKFIDYVNAIKFVTYTQVLGMDEISAYKAVFPLVEANKGKVSAYGRTLLVRDLIEMIELPYNLYFAPHRLKVMQNLLDIANNEDFSGMVRVKASEAFLTHSGKVFKSEPLVSLAVNNNTQINNLAIQEEQIERMQAFEQFVKAQKLALGSGLDLKELGAYKL